ncbi:MAG: protein kinase [Anaerolineae bacterium]
MSQMCPNCSFDNPDEATKCSNCPSPLRGLLGYRTILGGRYQVVSVLGCGAMGAVYLSEDKRLVGRRCAIKENRPDTNASPEFQAQAREQFLAEASVLGQLDHAGLPKVSDYFIENNREYLVMDYVDGEDLESALQRARQPVAEESVLNWTDQVLDALTYLHSQRPRPIIHRDIKPANIRVNLQGKAKLVDFGLVKLLDSSNPQTKAELRGIGTPAYAPLEQFASSEKHTDARSDIYALGATMYHLLTNIYPTEVHQRLLNSQTLTAPRQLNPHLSENTERVIMRAMEIYPAQRFQSAEEMRQELRASSAGTSRLTAKPVPQRRKNSGMSPWVFGVIGLVVVLLILGGAAYPTDVPTPVVEQPTAVESTSPVVTPTATKEPTSTPTVRATVAITSTPTVGSAQTISKSSLAGTIAYPVFNGKDYDLYIGQADGSGTRLYRKNASQPAFSPDGSRLAFHSWRLDTWGLMTMDVSGGNELLVVNFVEDQLPTWSPDGSEIILLTRREGDRKSRLVRVGSRQDRAKGVVIGEGEYPTISLDGRLIFKGWGSTGSGLHSANFNLQDVRGITDQDNDTAPAPSPDGKRVAFMSRRDGNWEIYIINTDGSGLQRLTTDPAEDGLPTWSPDGRSIAFISSRGGQWGIWAMTPSGGDQRLLFEMQGSPDGFVGTDRNASRGWTEERISWTK